MEINKRLIDIDYSKFDDNNISYEAKYGLPSDVKFCSKCVISNQRPNSCVEFKHTKESKKQTINFGKDDVCDACKAVEKKEQTIDWSLREKELIELCDKYRKTDGSFDCLVPGSEVKIAFIKHTSLSISMGCTL